MIHTSASYYNINQQYKIIWAMDSKTQNGDPYTGSPALSEVLTQQDNKWQRGDIAQQRQAQDAYKTQAHTSDLTTKINRSIEV
jgi:hypothetical protein